VAAAVAVVAVKARVVVAVAAVVVMVAGVELASGVPFRFSTHVRGRAGRRSLVPGRWSAVQSLAMAVTKFEYVQKRKAGNTSRLPPGFYMRCRGKWAGPFGTQEEAATAAAKALKVPTDTLERKPAKATRPSGPCMGWRGIVARGFLIDPNNLPNSPNTPHPSPCKPDRNAPSHATPAESTPVHSVDSRAMGVSKGFPSCGVGGLTGMSGGFLMFQGPPDSSWLRHSPANS
jgi:hypothetical protein